jgi:hypothetical protein
MFSVDSQMLYDRLVTMKAGESITYKDLSAVIVKNVQGAGRSNLMSARRKALSTHGLVFEAVRNEGLKCLTDQEKAKLGTSGIKSIRKKARNTSRKILAVENFNTLSKDEQVAHNLSLSLLGAISQMTKNSNIEKLESAIKIQDGKLPFAKTIESYLSRVEK